MPSEVQISLPRVEQLLRLVTHAESEQANLAERRHNLIQELGQLVRASSGFWGWGRGNPIDSKITPVAALHFGMTTQQWQTAIQASLSPDGVRLWSIPIRHRMMQSRHVTVTRPMLLSDEDWQRETNFRNQIAACGMDELLTSVNYFSNDCWMSITLGKPIGEPPFSEEDALLINLAMSSVVWMQPQEVEAVPAEAFAGLTPRQRAVILNLLSGKSRKEIAREMQISQHTVDDYVKAVYRHFGVSSITELASRFLQSQ